MKYKLTVLIFIILVFLVGCFVLDFCVTPPVKPEVTPTKTTLVTFEATETPLVTESVVFTPTKIPTLVDTPTPTFTEEITFTPTTTSTPTVKATPIVIETDKPDNIKPDRETDRKEKAYCEAVLYRYKVKNFRKALLHCYFYWKKVR
jgi:hypothetical protein